MAATQRVAFCEHCGNVTDRETLRCVACGRQHELQSELPYVANRPRTVRPAMPAAEVAMWRADATVPRFVTRCATCGPAEHIWTEPQVAVCLLCNRCAGFRTGGGLTR